MTYLDPYTDGPRHRPHYLRPVPSPTPRQQAAIDRGLRVISGGQDTPPYRSHVRADAYDGILRAIAAVTAIEEIADEITLYDPLVVTVAGEDGIDVQNCPACDGDHSTTWDQIVIDHVTRDDRPDRARRAVFTACWMCPAAGLDLEHILHGEDDVAEGIESGADLTDAADTAMQFERIIALERHPSWRGTPGGGAA
jgi:hypothetical protein